MAVADCPPAYTPFAPVRARIHCTEPYGFFTVPYGPYEPAHNQSAEPTRILPNVAWRLSSDEAVVVFGCTPPLARYFALTHYVVSTFRPRDPQQETLHKRTRIRDPHKGPA